MTLWSQDIHPIPRPVEVRFEEPAVMLVPSPGLHFFLTGFAPLRSRGLHAPEVA